jgi:hypothetical protein
MLSSTTMARVMRAKKDANTAQKRLKIGIHKKKRTLILSSTTMTRVMRAELRRKRLKECIYIFDRQSQGKNCLQSPHPRSWQGVMSQNCVRKG